MRKSLVRNVRVLCAALVVTALAGCQNSKSTTEASMDSGSAAAAEGVVSGYQEEIVFAPMLSFDTMDVQNCVSTSTKCVYSWVFNTLVEKDMETNELIPALAESWNQLSDTVWEFKLRGGVKFHDGTEFTAEDVKFTLERAKTQGGSKARVDSMEKVDVIDEGTVQIVLNQPDMDFIYKLTDQNLVILSKHAFETMDEEQANQVGTGAYQYEEWKHGEYVSVRSNPDYWNGEPKTKRIVVRTIPEAAARLIALQTGEVDIIQSPASTDLSYIADDPKLTLLQFPSSTVRYLGLNTTEEPFDNLLVRQAVAYGINRDELIAAVYQGNAMAMRNVMHPDNEFFTEVEGYSYNLDKAKELLTEAGYADGFTIKMISNQAVKDIAICTLVQSQLAKLGITVELQSMESATFNATIAEGKGYQLMVSGWSGYTIGPDNALRSILHTEGRINYTNVSDSYIDQTLDEARTIKDLAKRKAVYGELEEHATNLAAFYPIAVEMLDLGMKADVQGMKLPNGPILDFRELYIPAK